MGRATASPRPVLKDKQVQVDPQKVGLSYSGGGLLVMVELGVARAFIDEGIVPDVIAGVSAGALSAVAHALDPYEGRGVQLAIEILTTASLEMFRLNLPGVLSRVARERIHLRGIADNALLKPLLEQQIRRVFQVQHEITIDSIRHLPRLDGAYGDGSVGGSEREKRPRLLIGATNRLTGHAFWYPGSAPLADALVASSAVPGFFPWQEQRVGGEDLVLVDGGVVTNQPVSQLALEGCGTIYACHVGDREGSLPRPVSAVDNALESFNLMMHHAMHLESEYARLVLGDSGTIRHVRPRIQVPFASSTFSREAIERVVEQARRHTVDWIRRGFPDDEEAAE